MMFSEQLKQIDICALGPLRVSEALVKAGKVRGAIVVISSQVALRRARHPANPRRRSPHAALRGASQWLSHGCP